jgi:hypothetical protein
MVDEVLNRHPLRQLDHTAIVIGMEVSYHQVVDLLDPRITSRRGNPLRVSRKTRINEKGLPVRGYQQRGLAALHVNEINIEWPRRRLTRGCSGQECQSQPHSHDGFPFIVAEEGLQLAGQPCPGPVPRARRHVAGGSPNSRRKARLKAVSVW